MQQLESPRTLSLTQSDRKAVEEIRLFLSQIEEFKNYPLDWNAAYRPNDARLIVQGYQEVLKSIPEFQKQRLVGLEKELVIVPAKSGFDLIIADTASKLTLACGWAAACVIPAGLVIATNRAEDDSIRIQNEYQSKNPTTIPDTSPTLALFGLKPSDLKDPVIGNAYRMSVAVHEFTHTDAPQQLRNSTNSNLNPEWAGHKAQGKFLKKILGDRVSEPTDEQYLTFIAHTRGIDYAFTKSVLECFNGDPILCRSWLVGEKFKAVRRSIESDVLKQIADENIRPQLKSGLVAQMEDIKREPYIFADKGVGRFRSSIEFFTKKLYLQALKENPKLSFSQARRDFNSEAAARTIEILGAPPSRD